MTPEKKAVGFVEYRGVRSGLPMVSQIIRTGVFFGMFWNRKGRENQYQYKLKYDKNLTFFKIPVKNTGKE